MLTLVGLVVYLALCWLVAYLAGEKGRSAVKAFLLSLLLTPIVGFLVVVVLPSRALDGGPRRKGDFLVCSGCRRPYKVQLQACPRCPSSAPA